MSIKNLLQGWLGVSSTDAVCEKCGDVGASVMSFGRTCSADSSSSGKAFSFTVEKTLCYKCGVVQKHQDARNLDFEAKEEKQRQMRRDEDYIKAQEYFNGRDEKA